MAEASTSRNRQEPNPLIENIVNFTVNFFSRLENHNQGPIERYFLPVILNYSEKLYDGKIFDTFVFRARLTVEQLEYCRRVFKDAKILNTNTDLIRAHEMFHYLVNFDKAKELIITFYDDDTFNFPVKKSKFTKIHATCVERTVWKRPMDQILNHNLAVLKSFTFTAGYLSIDSIMNLMPNELISLELVNIYLYTDKHADSLIRYIGRLRELTHLKLIYTTPKLPLNPFNCFFEKMEEKLSTPMKELTALTFSIKQNEKREKEYRMNLFPNLNTLEIHYTPDKDFHNIGKLITAINIARTNKLSNPADIIFTEYLPNPWSSYNATEKRHLRRKSEEYKNSILEMNGKYITIHQITKID